MKAARCHHRRRRARNPATAIRPGSVKYTSPRTLKILAITVSAGVRPETMSRSHASSTRWMRASVPWLATSANTTTVSATTPAVS